MLVMEDTQGQYYIDLYPYILCAHVCCLQLEQGPHVFSPTSHIPISPFTQFLKKFELAQNLTSSLIHVSGLVITTLFNSLMSAVFGKETPSTKLDKLTVWFKSYR